MLIEYLPIKPEIIDKEKEIEKLEKKIMEQLAVLSISIEMLELLKDEEGKVMTNRDKLMQTDICDMLCNMNKVITGFNCDCVMAALTDGEKTYGTECGGKCRECIAKWLDEEAE